VTDKIQRNKTCAECQTEGPHCFNCEPSAASDCYATEQQVLKAVYESGLHQYAPGVIYRQSKDGIDIDVPTQALMNFVRKLQSA